MWTRGKIQALEVCVSDCVLPSRGSEHQAFVEMLFLWGERLNDSRYRSVVLPYGFCLRKIHEERHEIRDLNDFTRAVVLLPKGKNELPSIVPVRRFSFNAIAVDEQFRGTVGDWDSIVYRTPRFKTQKEALSTAKKWLDENQPKWDSYISQINFERRP
jgi:hypothetical protein